jgi:acyl carrier protein
MEDSKLELKVKVIIADMACVTVEEFNNETNVKQELNLDSLDEVELIMNLEKEFGIQIPDEDAEKVETVADYVAVVERFIANNSEVNLENETES